MKNYYISALFLALVIQVNAQILVPLTQNPVLRDLQENYIPDNDLIELRNEECDLEQLGITYLASGERLEIPIGIDTVGLDSNQMSGQYVCIQCNNSPFGNAFLRGDTLIYETNPNTESGSHEFSVQYEDELGTRTAFFNFVIRRGGVSYFLPEIPIKPEESTTIEADISLLSGQIACSFFLDCSSSYDGRDREVNFLQTNIPDSRFRYTASRFGGVDSVCLVLCNEVATCDTFNYTFRIQQSAIEDLPIFDDFSYQGPFPDSTIWLDDDPYINRQMAIDPPSFGVATFDGLNKNGIPYGGGYGQADRLTSKVIKMEQYQNELVVLSYWLQPQGLGNKPEPEDSIAVEFKNRTGDWEVVSSYLGIPLNVPNSVIDTFTFYRDTIPEEFKHDDFQFRFVSYSDRTGVLDNWQLDYIRLEADAEPTFGDVAFQNNPGFLLTPYSSVPYRHLTAEDRIQEFLTDSIEVFVRNFTSGKIGVDPSRFNIIELNNNINLLGTDQLVLLNNVESNLNPNSSANYSYLLNEVPRFAQFYPNVAAELMNSGSFTDTDQLRISMSYELSANQNDGFPAVVRNDVASTVTVLDDYFAYDDGTAEAGFIAQENNSVAVKFTSYIEDSLRAVRIHFPVTTVDASDQIFDLRVYVVEDPSIDSLNRNSVPVYEAFSLPVEYTSSFYDTLQGFTTYPLVDRDGAITPVHLPAGSDFYISWTQVSTCDGFQCIPVGFDRNTAGGRDAIFINLLGDWEPLDSAIVATLPTGSLMLRAVVGDQTPFATSVEEINPKEDQYQYLS